MIRKSFAIVAAILAAGALVGCALGMGAEPAEGGSVFLNLGFTGAKTILPPISMDVVEYEVSAEGPGTNVIDPTVITENTTFRNLVPGEWTFQVVGRNVDHTPIGGGFGSATVVIGETSSLAITVSEYTGPGSLQINLAWEPDTVEYPVWVGQLKDRDSILTDMTFVTDEVACTSQSNVADLHEGYYAMTVRLFNAPAGIDGTEILSTGAAAIVRIAAGYETVGSYVLHAVQGWGQIDIDLSLDMNDPLILTPSEAFGDVAVYNDETRTFTVTADEACTSIFYLRGHQVGVDSYDLVANDLAEGEVYRLDVLCFSTDGSRAASGTWLVSRGGYSPEMVRISGTTPSASSWGTGYTVRYTLRSEADPNTILNTVTVPNQNSSSAYYSFESVAPGTYILKMEWVEYNTTAWSWWRNGMSVQYQETPDTNCVITVPHEAQTYDFNVSF